jgi:hypothetical protein
MTHGELTQTTQPDTVTDDQEKAGLPAVAGPRQPPQSQNTETKAPPPSYNTVAESPSRLSLPVDVVTSRGEESTQTEASGSQTDSISGDNATATTRLPPRQISYQHEPSQQAVTSARSSSWDIRHVRRHSEGEELRRRFTGN